MDRIVSLLTVTRTGDGDNFVAPNGRGGWASIFGGQVIAQALAAGTLTVADDRKVNSLHAYFTRAAQFDSPIELSVDRIRDGGRFSNRLITATQDGQQILTMIASWHIGEQGPVRGGSIFADLPDPDSLAKAGEGGLNYGRRPTDPYALTYLDVRPIVGCEPFVQRPPEPPEGMMWVRFLDVGDATPAMSRNLVAYLSDLFMVGTAVQPHRAEVGPRPTLASIDHSVWFHADPPKADWMIFRQESTWASEGRALIRGELFTRDGDLVASITQEALLRLN